MKGPRRASELCWPQYGWYRFLSWRSTSMEQPELVMKKGHRNKIVWAVCLLFSVSLCFSLPSFLFTFPFWLSFSVSLSLCIYKDISLLFIIFFLPSLFSFCFAFFWFLVLSLCFFSFFLSFIHKRTTSNFGLETSVFWVFCRALSFKSLFLIFVLVLMLSCAFC